jgi:hypothetical protein
LHVERSGSLTIELPRGHVFPLFSPEGERAWIEGWDPEYLHPPHPSDAAGTIFRTTHDGEKTLWLILHYDPHHALAEYARFTAGSRLGTVRVQCAEEAQDTTHVAVTYSLTALTPAGNKVLSALTPASYKRMLGDWHSAIMRSQSPRPQ